jgi:Leucine-rich repeat (LRR) protein
MKLNKKHGQPILLQLWALLVASGLTEAEICSFDSSEQVLKCKTRTLQTGLGVQAQTEDLQNAKKLQVQCSDVFFSESEVQVNHFGNLPSLVDLDVEFCKVRNLPARSFSGLRNLERLSLQSHNSDWSTVILELDADALKDVGQLSDINLAHNNIWSLPKNLLCHLDKLLKLNLSRNHLLELTDLGVEQCSEPLPVQVLDLSHNLIGSVQSQDLAKISGLRKLNLSNNRLTIIGDNVLQSLANLDELNLANNELAALPPAAFDQSGKLEMLHLQNNTLTLLPAGLFDGLASLKVLNLSRNAIGNHHLLSGQAFSGLQALEVLDLSHNKLSKIDASIFRNLKSLRILNLEGNAIRTVEADSFLHQKLLENLVFSNNKIEDLPEEAFNGAREMRSLVLDHNQVVSMPDNIFRHCPLLEDLSLDNNLLNSVPESIASHLLRLRTLDLGENRIGELSNGDFNALQNLYGLRLAGNQLQRIGADIFNNNTALHVLNLARNKLVEIEQNAFEQLKDLRALRLDNNALTDINGVVTYLGNLQWLNVSSNKLIWFDFAFVPLSVEWLDLHQNAIEELGNFYKLREGFNLKTLDASANKIKKLTKLSLSNGLETILLARNEISEVEEMVFSGMMDLKLVDLSHNRIANLRLDSLFIGGSKKGKILLPFFCPSVTAAAHLQH